MSKKQKSQDDFESELKSEVQVFDGKAVTILQDSPREFRLVKITLDLKTLEVGTVEVVDTAASKPEAVEKFKILVVRNGVI